MNLASRLEAVRLPQQPAAALSPPRPATTTPLPPPPTDALTRLKDRVGKALFERMGSRMNDPTLSEDALRAIVLGELDEVVEAEKVPLSTEDSAARFVLCRPRSSIPRTQREVTATRVATTTTRTRATPPADPPPSR